MKLASIFTDSLVLQRDMPVRVFGTGNGKAVVSFCGNTAKAQAQDGKWCVTLPEVPYGGPYTMEIDLNGEKKVLKDILVGDVFLCCGQSNMAMPLFQTQYGYEDARTTNNDNIRYFTVPRRYKPGADNHGWNFVDLYDCDIPWQKSCEEAALRFSAIGHYFAKYIYEQTQVPVGIVSCNWGGRKIEPFIDKKYLYDNPDTSKLIEEFDQYCDSLDMEDYEKKYAEFLSAMENAIQTTRKDYIKETEKLGIRPATQRYTAADFPAPVYGPYDSFSPSTLWQSMFATIVPYGVKAMLWYQGESNGYDMDYTSKYLTFLECIRENFQQDIDAYAVELAPFMQDTNLMAERLSDPLAKEQNWAFLREQQQDAVKKGTKNYLVTTIDLGEMFDIHPRNKKDVAYRLALKVRKYTYGEDIPADQPVYSSVEFKEGKAYITLENGDGLYGNTGMVAMQIAGSDKIPYPATVEIAEDGRLCVYSDKVPEPVLVRYGFDMYYFGGYLYNNANLPLAPFRTDRD